MKKITFQVLLFAFALIIFSCSKSTKMVHRNVTGKAGELLVVMARDAWNDSTGSLIRQTLGQPCVSLPQDEPMFDLINIPPDAFKDLFKTTRNILMARLTDTGDKSGIEFTDDLYAYPQACVVIQSKSRAEFDSIYRTNSHKILSYFLNAENKRLNMNYEKFYDRAVFNVLKKELNLTINTPPGFSVAKSGPGYVWIRYITPEVDEHILVFTYPYKSDSTFTARYLTDMRDSILHQVIPGPSSGSFMTTEKSVDPVFTLFEHNTNYAAEMRGLWKVENDFMGGPYIALTELDPFRQRVVEVFGFVYSPGKNKRNYIRQLEAMIYSLKLDDQEKNNQINLKLKLGNQ